MTRNQIIDRIELLYLTLQFCKQKMKMFTVGERICINQERFQWLHILSNPQAEPRPVSVKLEAKLEETLKLIVETHFEPSTENPFYDEREPITANTQ